MRFGRMRQWAAAHEIGLAIAASSAVAALIVAGLWFRTGRFYADGDLGLLLNDSLRGELGAGWTHQHTGAGGPSYELARAVEVVFVNVARVLGGTEALGGRLLFACIFAFAASGSAAFAARMTRRAPLVFAAGLFGAFNPGIMVNLPNFLLPLVTGMLAWFGALTIDACAPHGAPDRRRDRPRVFAVVTLGLAYVSLNPPLVAVVVGAIVAMPLVAAALSGTGVAGARRAARFLRTALSWALPLAVWWLVPYVHALRGAVSGGTVKADTDPFAWSWSHAHGSFDRIFTMVAKWSWPDPTFGADASSLAASPWLWLAFALPVGLVAAPLVAHAERRRAALWVVCVGCVLALVGKGLHAPMTELNATFYRLVPGAWLLREPMSKVGPLLALTTIVGWMLALDGVQTWLRARQRRRSWRTAAVRAIVALAVAAPLVFAWPMLLGTVLTSRERVRLPGEWRDIAAVVNNSSLRGKALVLPLIDFYQVPTTWGYYGVDTTVEQLIERPVIVPDPQAYVGDPGSFGDLARAVQAGVLGGDADAALNAMRVLGVSHVVVRKDIDHDSEIRTVDMPEAGPLIAGMRRVPGTSRIAGNGVAEVFAVPASAGIVETLAGTLPAVGERGDGLAAIVTSAPPDFAVTASATAPSRPAATAARTVRLDADGTRELPAGAWTLHRRPLGAPLVELARVPGGLRVQDAARLAFDGRPAATRGETLIPAATPVTAVAIDGELVDLETGRAFSRIEPGAELELFTDRSVARPSSAPRLSDCNRYDDRDRRAAGLDATVVTTGDYAALRLAARVHSSCASYALGGVGAGDVLRVAYEQRAVSGAAPRTCLWQSGVDRCAPLALTATRTGDWFRMSALYRVPTDVTGLAMYLYADEPAHHTDDLTEAWYRGLDVRKLTRERVTSVPPVVAPAQHVSTSTQAVELEVATNVPAPAIDGPWELGDCARTDDRSFGELGLRATALDEADPMATRLEARRHAACVSAPITNVRHAITYELAFDADVIVGARPRMCLWQDAAARCASFVEVAGGDTEHEHVYRGRFDAGAGLVRLFLYADAIAAPTTIDYRNLSFRAVADDVLVVVPSRDTALPSPPTVEWHRVDPAHYRVSVDGARSRFVLAFNEAYADGWRLEGLPDGARAEHIELDGYRNGWIIDARGDLDLMLRYTPARYVQMAARFSQATAVLLVGSFVSAPFVRSIRRRYRHRSQVARARDTQGSRRVPLPDDWLLPGR
jgi:arabinofuranan 3-O-arabinosyltransferase